MFCLNFVVAIFGEIGVHTTCLDFVGAKIGEIEVHTFVRDY